MLYCTKSIKLSCVNGGFSRSYEYYPASILTPPLTQLDRQIPLWRWNTFSGYRAPFFKVSQNHSNDGVQQ